HVDRELHQLHSQRGKPLPCLFRSFGGAKLKHEVLTLDVAILLHSLSKRLQGGDQGLGEEGDEKTYTIDLGRLLRLPRQPPTPRQQPEASDPYALHELAAADLVG